MGMAYTEVTTESWGSRLGNSLKGIVIGLVLMLAAGVLLFWNEGRAVKTEQALNEGADKVVNVETNTVVNPEMNNQLVHMSGQAVTNETLTDAQFGISLPAIALERHVQYYQWVEHAESHTEKQMGGSTRTVTTYTYSQKWCDEPQDSSSFKEPGHDNFVVGRFDDEKVYAHTVQFGAFRLSEGQIHRIGNKQGVDLSSFSLPQTPGCGNYVSGNTLTISRGAMQQGYAPAPQQPVAQPYGPQQQPYGAPQQPVAQPYGPQQQPYGAPQQQPVAQPYGPQQQPAAQQPYGAPQQPVAQPYGPQQQPVAQQPYGAPQQVATQAAPPACIGDVRITWDYIAPQQTLSIVAVQNGDTFSSYVAKSGYSVNLLNMGEKTADEMFRQAQMENTMMLWILRFVGWLLMFLGLRSVLSIISVVADVIPFLGNVAEIGVGIVCFLLSSVISLVIVAVAWFWYRPILSVCLLAAAAVCAYLLHKRKSKQKAEAAAQQPAAAEAPAPTDGEA